MVDRHKSCAGTDAYGCSRCRMVAFAQLDKLGIDTMAFEGRPIGDLFDEIQIASEMAS